MHTPRDLAIITVTWNVRDLTLNALRTLYDDLATARLDAAVMVVDNQSTDGTPEAIRSQFPQAQVIEAGANLGFAAGNNVALRALGFQDAPSAAPIAPKAVLLLNPDTLTTLGVIRTMYDALFTLPNAGMVGAQLAHEDGSFQHGAFMFPGLFQLMIDLLPLPARLYRRVCDSQINGRYPRQRYTQGDPFPVDYTLGATMMLRREVIEQTGMFDEQFFMYCEEVDWAMRIRAAGWDIYTVPRARIVHLVGRSSQQVRPRSLVNLWDSRLRLYRKHYPPLKLAVARWMVRIAMAARQRRVQRDPTLDAVQRAALADAYRHVIRMAAT